MLPESNIPSGMVIALIPIWELEGCTFLWSRCSQPLWSHMAMLELLLVLPRKLFAPELQTADIRDWASPTP